MSLTTLNYESLNEEFVVWYYKTYGKLPKSSTQYSRSSLIKIITSMRSEFNRNQRSQKK